MSLARLLLALAATGAIGCKAAIPNGVFGCSADADCPADFVCRMNADAERRCYALGQEPGAATDSDPRPDGGAGMSGGGGAGGNTSGRGAAGTGAAGTGSEPQPPECEGACEANEDCAVRGDEVTCSCKDGYTDEAGSCVDVDECATDNGGCGDPVYFECKNEQGAEPTCADIDECATRNGECGDPVRWLCTNQEGAAPTCGDIDECAAGVTVACRVGATSCVNTSGGFECTCDASYRVDPASGTCWPRWAIPVLVESDSEPATGPRVAAGGNNGDALAVWAQAGAVMASRYAVQTDTWSTPARIDSGSGAASDAAISGNGAGATAVWRESSRIWASRYETGLFLNNWSTAQMIDDVGRAIGPVEVAHGAGGHALAIWGVQTTGSVTCSDLWMARAAANGAWDTAASLQLGGSGICENLRVGAAVSGTGHGLTLWDHLRLDTPGGENFHVFGSSCAPGAACAAPTVVSSIDEAIHPVVAMNAVGSAVVAWRDTIDNSTAQLWVRRYSAATGWGEATMGDTAGPVDQPSVAIDSHGNALLIYPRTVAPGHTAIMARWLRASTGVWSTPVAIDSKDFGLTLSEQERDDCLVSCPSVTAVAMDANGNGIAVWSQVAQMGSDVLRIHANRFEGEAWGEAFVVSTSETDSAQWPAVAMDPMGNATAVWQQSDGTRTNIWGARFE